ncbi:MAG: TetR/AcrR family transcriptional regulator [Actinomycetaceae bacterium]|nr:TetR/AcrR family transcriptional regulator [Actinomycetaceae bacterium]
MPKISAPTVREHHERVKEKLVAGTERILWESGPEALSAAAVAKTAGIARNSIYRYVESVDDLRLLAIARYMPRWREAVFSQVDAQAEPEHRLAQFMVACVEQTRKPSHGWLVRLARHSSSKKKREAAGAAATYGEARSANGDAKAGAAGAEGGLSEREAIRRDIAKFHVVVDEFIARQWDEIGVDDVGLWAGYSRALLFEALQQVEKEPDSEAVSATLRSSILAMVQAARGSGNEG